MAVEFRLRSRGSRLSPPSRHYYPAASRTVTHGASPLPTHAMLHKPRRLSPVCEAAQLCAPHAAGHVFLMLPARSQASGTCRLSAPRLSGQPVCGCTHPETETAPARCHCTAPVTGRRCRQAGVWMYPPGDGPRPPATTAQHLSPADAAGAGRSVSCCQGSDPLRLPAPRSVSDGAGCLR